LVKNQVELYFSRANLSHDRFLRERMDSEGYVFVTVIAKFNRVAQLTSDLELVAEAIKTSPVLELEESAGASPTRLARVRVKGEWKEWVLQDNETGSPVAGKR